MPSMSEVDAGGEASERALAAWPEGEVWFRGLLRPGAVPWHDEALLETIPPEAAGSYGVRVGERVRVDGTDYEAGDIVIVDTRADQERLAVQVRNARAWLFPWYSRFVPDSLLRPHRRPVDLADYRRQFTARFWNALLMTLGLGAAAIYFADSGMIFLIFAVMWGLYPLVEAGMALTRRVDRLSVEELNVRLVNFEFFRRWIATRKSPLVIVSVSVLAILFVAQMWVGLDPSIEAAALVRERVLENGEWWRVVTTGLLHGSALHVAFNGFALYTIGRILAALVSASFLSFVFLLSVVCGSLASLWLSPGGASVGASGGILGCLGFLLVTTWKFRGTIPGFLEANLIQSILVLAIFGLVGNRFIDNAAHGGGLVAGILVGLLMYPALKLNVPKAGLPVRVLSFFSFTILAAAVAWIARIFLLAGTA